MAIKNMAGRCNTKTVEKYIGTAYDEVQCVSDNMDIVCCVADSIEYLNCIGCNFDSVVCVSNNMTSVVCNAENMADIECVADNMCYVVSACDWAACAEEKANCASDSANFAEEKAVCSETSAVEAEQYADSADLSAFDACQSAITANQSDINACASSDAAALSAASANASDIAACSSKDAAALSESNAALSESNAANSCQCAADCTVVTIACTAVTIACTGVAIDKANCACISACESQQWACCAEDYADALATGVVAKGPWDASTTNFPPVPVPDTIVESYRIDVAGTMSNMGPVGQPNLTVVVGDILYWGPSDLLWYVIRVNDIVTPEYILASLLTVDGSGSCLDADFLDGCDSSDFLNVTGTACAAAKWSTPRELALTGDVTGNTTIDGTGNVSIAAVVTADSHSHTIANVTGLQAELDTKLECSLYTANDVLAKLLTVDGSGSGLDADLLDGLDSTYFGSDADVVAAQLTATNACTCAQDNAIDIAQNADDIGCLYDCNTDVVACLNTKAEYTYVDACVAACSGDLETNKVDRCGDTMTGPLILVTPTIDSHAACKGYTDSRDTTILTQANEYTDDEIDILDAALQADIDTRVLRAGDVMGGSLSGIPPTAEAHFTRCDFVVNGDSATLSCSINYDFGRITV